jgi:dTDP-4-amino-4,6-dideoxygalactose transaminase
MHRSTRRETHLGLSRPSIGDEEIAELLDSIRSGWLTMGPKVAAFEARLAAYVGVEHVCCLASCTAGLTLALRVGGVQPGDEVLLPAMTFVSCANAVVHNGAVPVLVDSDPHTGLIDLDHAESLIGPRTRALMPVHLAGHPVDLDRVNELRDRHGLLVVEDAAHAIGARWAGRSIGSHGNLTAFSFHATKNITTFEGGALVIDDEATAERVQRLALHGLSRSAWSRHGSAMPAQYEVDEPGFKFAMNDIAAAVGIHQLARLDGWIERRHELAGRYDERLAELPLGLPPDPPAHARHAHHLYIVHVRDDAPIDRDSLLRTLMEQNIGGSVHFKPIHHYRYYAERLGVVPGDLAVADDLARHSLSLPLFPAMTDADVDDVADTLRVALG